MRCRGLVRVVTVLMCGFAVLASSCSSNPPSSLAFEQEDVVITMWSWGGLGYDNLIAEFEAANPGVTVDMRESGYDQHHDGLLSAIAADGELPDIAAIDVAYIPVFWEFSDKLTDLRDYGAEEKASRYLDWL